MSLLDHFHLSFDMICWLIVIDTTSAKSLFWLSVLLLLLLLSSLFVLSAVAVVAASVAPGTVVGVVVVVVALFVNGKSRLTKMKGAACRGMIFIVGPVWSLFQESIDVYYVQLPVKLWEMLVSTPERVSHLSPFLTQILYTHRNIPSIFVSSPQHAISKASTSPQKAVPGFESSTSRGGGGSILQIPGRGWWCGNAENSWKRRIWKPGKDEIIYLPLATGTVQVKYCQISMLKCWTHSLAWKKSLRSNHSWIVFWVREVSDPFPLRKILE